MAKLAALQVASILPPAPIYNLLLVATLAAVGGLAFGAWERHTASWDSARRNRSLERIALIPAATLVFMGLGAAIDTQIHAQWRQPTPTMLYGAAAWIVSGSALLATGFAPMLRRNGDSRLRGSAPRALALVLATSLAAGLVLGGITILPNWSGDFDWVVVDALQLAYVTACLLWFGVLTLGEPAGRDVWSRLARLFGFLNLTPGVFLGLSGSILFLHGFLPGG